MFRYDVKNMLCYVDPLLGNDPEIYNYATAVAT
jgi:hypothetical protein